MVEGSKIKKFLVTALFAVLSVSAFGRTQGFLESNPPPLLFKDMIDKLDINSQCKSDLKHFYRKGKTQKNSIVSKSLITLDEWNKHLDQTGRPGIMKKIESMNTYISGMKDFLFFKKMIEKLHIKKYCQPVVMTRFFHS